jgi:hypothetical protein
MPPIKPQTMRRHSPWRVGVGCMLPTSNTVPNVTMYMRPIRR